MATKTTIRLSDQDEKNVAKIVKTGAAKDTSEAIRLALALVAHRLIETRERR